MQILDALEDPVAVDVRSDTSPEVFGNDSGFQVIFGKIGSEQALISTMY